MARGSKVESGYARGLAIVRLVFFVLFGVIVWRLFYLQILNYNFYAGLAAGRHDVLAKLVPERGEIYIQDPLSQQKLTPVAVNQTLNLVFAQPKHVVDAAVAAHSLAPLLKMQEMDVEDILKREDPWEPLLHGVDDDTAATITSLKLDGIGTTPEEQRYYPDGDLLAQTLGFVGYVNDVRKGQYGAEGYWDSELAGTPGQLRSERDPAGSLITVAQSELIPAVNGVNLNLTIDKNIQAYACAALAKGVSDHGANSGSLVIMNPATGEVLAMCNAPSFDPNNYSQVADLSQFNNDVISTPYEPGSVFKPITMAAALDRGKVTPETTYTDAGEVVIGTDHIKNSDLKAHGVQTMTQVLEASLNTGAIFAMRQVGPTVFTDYVKRFGFGEPTGIELSNEQAGNIKALNKPGEIYAATASFGQGITVTPLQLAAAFGAIANHGELVKPYVVKEVDYSDGRKDVTQPTIVRQVFSQPTANTLSAMMVSVVENGHGKRAAVPGYYVAGKTGTAQIPVQGKYDPTKTIGSFVGFAPVDNPKFVMVVKVVEPKDVVFAESSAAPVFGEVAKFLLQYYQVPPERPVK